jgi:hypothetical protein
VNTNNGVHILCKVMRDPADKGGQVLLRIEAVPLPDDDAVLMAVYYAARDAIHAKLTEKGLTEPTRVELPPAKGRVQ